MIVRFDDKDNKKTGNKARFLMEMKKAGFRIENSSVKFKNGECVIAEK